MTAPVEAPEHTDTDAPDVLHVTCLCQEGKVPELALCGHDATEDTPYTGGPVQPCLVCKDHIENNLPCRLCGFQLD